MSLLTTSPLSILPPDFGIILVRGDFTPALRRRLINGRRRIASMISRRGRRVRAPLHAVVIRVLRLLHVVGVVVRVVRVRGVHRHAAAAPVARVVRAAALYHPAVVGEGWEVFAHAVARVPVPADEVGEEEEEEDRDDGVADGGAGL